MVAPVFSGPALDRKIRADFSAQWAPMYEFMKSEYPWVRFGLGTEDYQTVFGFSTTPPYPRYTPWGERPAHQPNRYLTYSVEQLRWMVAIEWLTRDRELSNLGSIDRDALAAGDNFGTLFERVLFQIITNSTDPLLLPNVPLAPDGAALWSTTDGDGADRFGVSGGNIVSGQSFSSGAGIQAGLYAALIRIGSFLNEQGQPSVDPGVLKRGVTYLAPLGLATVVHQAFAQRFPSNSTVTAGAVQVSNLIMDAGIPVRLVLTPRLTGSVAYVISDQIHASEGGTPLIAEIAAKTPESKFYDASNDKDYGERGLEGAHWESWFAAGVNLPRGAVSVTT